MGWRSIIITQHAKLTYTSNMMKVQTDDGINEIPLDDIDTLLISTTQAVLSSFLLNQLALRKINVVFTDNRQMPSSQLCLLQGRSNKVIEKQINWSDKRKSILWTKIIYSKIQNQISLLKIKGLEYQDLQEELSKLEVNDFSNREATVARKYFQRLFGNKFKRRESAGVNDALNYGYAIILSTVSKEIAVHGYLNELGIHHRSETNDSNLACDFMESFRPFVDYWVSDHEFHELTPDIKYELVDLVNIEVKYNSKIMLLKNVIREQIQDYLNFLNEQKVKNKRVEFVSEVSSNALNGHV